MPQVPKRTPSGEILTALTMDLFRVNSLILLVGDRMAAHLDLTGARWQILGAITRAEQPQSVAWLARNMGAKRQNVQRVVNDLHDLAFLTFEPNPRHRRAQLVVLTEKGRKAYAAAMALQAPWVNELAEGLEPDDLATCHRVLLALRQKLEGTTSDAQPIS
jgi:DNA-binding MarR family transcriptional regulator